MTTDRQGRPLAFTITPGQAHESTQALSLVRMNPLPEAVCADKGYAYPSLRRAFDELGITANIPTKKNQPADPEFDPTAYRERARVEGTIGHLKEYRRIATRYEKLGSSFRSMIALACLRWWW